MENMIVNITPKRHDVASVKNATIVATADKTDSTSTSSVSPASSTDQVEISEEARKKSAEEKNQAAMRKLAGNDSVDETEEKSADLLDQMIAELQEKIAELMQEISGLRAKDDQQSIDKVKALETEVTMLNLQLMELLERKLESTKSGS